MNNLSYYEKIPALENNFTVKFRVYSGKNLVPHWHEHLEMLYVTGGECEFICNGKCFDARRGDLVVVNSAEIHSFVARGTAEYYSIILYPEFLSDIKRISTPICNRVRDDEKIEHFFAELHREYTDNKTASDMATKGILYMLLTYLYRNYVYDGEWANDGPLAAELLQRLDRVITYISEHYHEKITTATLAEMCYVSEAHFCRFFKSAVGKTVTRYVNEYRVEKAKVLLLKTGESIAEIGVEVGFEDPNYFSRVFRSVTGISPQEFRNRQATGN